MPSPKQDPFTFKTAKYLEWYRNEPAVAHNSFIDRPVVEADLPTFADVKAKLPAPRWPKNQLAVDAYWKAWELGLKNTHKVEKGSKFIENYIDAAFNGCIFLWDSVFILQFGRYGRRAFDYQKTLDNFYACQHKDGFICREIRADGSDQWTRYDPASTGPQLFAWSEWEHYLQVKDTNRLRAVFPALAAYHDWMRLQRSWPDGSYWSTGLGCGMDNLHRLPADADQERDHGWMSWVDATYQALLDARSLEKIAKAVGEDASDFEKEGRELSKWAESHLWDPSREFYCDRDRSGHSGRVRHIGGFWALAAESASPARAKRMAQWIEDPHTFWRHHPVPSLAADEAGYRPDGGYWLGGVWAPTNYMVLRGLWNYGLDDVAFRVAQHHHDRVLEVFMETGTLWENYAPETSKPGNPAKADFVGWTGLPPIAVLFEGLFGLRPTSRRLVWDIRLTDEFGVTNYPVGVSNVMSLHCPARSSEKDEPKVEISASEPVEVEIRWTGGSRVIKVTG